LGKRADILVAQTAGLIQFNGGGTQYLVQTPAGVLYYVYCDSGSDVAFKKSTDGGLSWSAPTIVFAGTVTQLSIWYDRWSDISAGLIHCAYVDSGIDDILYRSINTESSDALSTQTTVFAGATTAAGCGLSITRARGGNIYVWGMIDAGAEGGFFRSTDTGGTWASRTVNEVISTTDMMILTPGFAADNQDIMGFFWDISANEVSRYVHDDSGNSWAETSISGSMAEQAAATSFPHFACAVDITNSQILLVSWNGIDTANQDLRCWTITESAITEVTNVVLNATDDCGLAGIGIDTATGYWWVFYAGTSAGSETWLTSVNIYCKCSKDSGTTWGAETKLTAAAHDITWLVTCPRFFGPPLVAYHNDIALDELMINVEVSAPRATYMMGV